MTTTKAAMTAFDNLRTNQRQLDIDGRTVGVSRQALEETLDIYGELLAAVKRLAQEVEFGGASITAIRAMLQDAHAVIQKAETRNG